ncbi:MAG TPA: hypothetical protein VGG57_18985 [Stellaceae bacterium]
MAFIFALDLADPIPTELHPANGACAAVAYVGYDDACPLTYSIMVGFEVGAACLEYYFKFIEADAEDYTERDYWDGREVGEFVDAASRSHILEVVKRVTILLIEEVRPECFYYCTHGDGLPPHALEKYHHINEIFTGCGYRVTMTNSSGGRYSWWVEQEAHPPVVPDESSG